MPDTPTPCGCRVEHDNHPSYNSRISYCPTHEFSGEPVYVHHANKYAEWQVTPEAIEQARRALGLPQATVMEDC